MAAAAEIEREVASWVGVTTHRHRFGGVEFRLGRRELGHLHGDALADLPFPRRIAEMLVETGRAERHRFRPDSGWIAKPIAGAQDVHDVIELFRLSYERARVAAARHRPQALDPPRPRPRGFARGRGRARRSDEDPEYDGGRASRLSAAPTAEPRETTGKERPEMPHYRLIFPADIMIENTPTAQYESDEIRRVGDVIEHGGRRWRVSKEPTEQPGYGETADLMVWPAE